MLKRLSVFLLKLSGWTVRPDIPKEAQRCVMIAAPHTSNWDLWYARLAFFVMDIPLKFTIKREWMHFGTFIDVHGHFFDTTHFPASVRDYPFRGDGVYLVLGKIVEEFGFPSMTVEKMAKMPLRKDPRLT